MNKWVEHFTDIARLKASKSKDTNTKVGAVIFDEVNGVEVIAQCRQNVASATTFNGKQSERFMRDTHSGFLTGEELDTSIGVCKMAPILTNKEKI